MKSMTGFGFREYQDDNLQLSLDLKSYNNRYLDIICNIPPFLNALEPAIRSFFSSRVQRGRVEVYVKIRELKEDITVHLDEPVVKSYIEVLRGLAKTAGIEGRITLSHLLKMEGILKSEKKRDSDYYWSVLEKVLSEAFIDFEQSRIDEGARTRRDIQSLLEQFSSQVTVLEHHASEMEQNITETLRKRFEQVLGDGYDESRLLAETAVMLVKYDTNEEIIRIKSHLESFRSIAASGNAVGKKLDFVCQELGREINTIGSKSGVIEVNHAVVEMKDTLEKIREQLRNVE